MFGHNSKWVTEVKRMAYYLKKRALRSESADADRAVKATVEGILDDIRYASASAPEVSRA
jgi:hypothetical protein